MLTRSLIVLLLTSAECLCANDSAAMRVCCLKTQGSTAMIVYGSCVVITDNALELNSKRSVLTAAHVVGDSPAMILVEIRKDHWVRCTLEKIDRERDLALLKAPEDLPHSLRLAQAPVFSVIASRQAGPIHIQSAIPFRVFARCSLFGPGMSGGALIDSDGKLCGIVTAGLLDPKTGGIRPEIGIFVSINEIRAFLDEKNGSGK